MMMMMMIQFNSVLYYLCAESTATNPITDTAQCRYTYLHNGHIQHKVNGKLQEHIIAENKQTNKQTKMIKNDNCEQKSLELRNKTL
jgi:hypothetical protein